jgi:hypothetical protein
MFSYVQNLLFLPNQRLETGLTGITIGLTSLSGSKISQIDVQNGMTGSCSFDSTFLGPQGGDSTTVPLEKDKAELQFLRGYDFD